MQRVLDLENAYQQSENSLAIARIRARTLHPNPMRKRGTDISNNSSHNLRDRMQLTVLLKTTDGPTALVVPTSALLRDGLHTFVFVQKPDDYLERRRVTAGRSDGEFVEITSGVVAGEAVVSAGGRDLQTAFASLR
jgi:membrane fusion protein, heavy metal efflux system